jgi:hypothetical protein
LVCFHSGGTSLLTAPITAPAPYHYTYYETILWNNRNNIIN